MLNSIQKLVLGTGIIILVFTATTVALNYNQEPAIPVEDKVFSREMADPQPFEIRQKETYKMIAMRLEKEGFIEDDRDFVQYIRMNHLQNRLRVGEYLLEPSMSISEITERLISGKGAVRSFHVYDGVNLEQIAATFAEKKVMQEDYFWDLVRNGDFTRYPFIEAPNDKDTRLEGFLYPGHYEYRESDSPQDIVEMMIDRFIRNMESIERNNNELSYVEIVTLASLIEKEAANDEEKPLIASVYMNRLQKGQPLQCDATVVYAMDIKKSTLSFSDYQINSPYNTYLIPGLPPTPIASPGYKSLEAAANPAKSDYFYYLLDTKNLDGHIFAKDYEEHLENRKKYGYD